METVNDASGLQLVWYGLSGKIYIKNNADICRLNCWLIVTLLKTKILQEEYD